jgi:SAM-dependent methyltransferase
VVAIDASPTLIRHAREADRRASYLLADAAALPFHDESFDLAVAYNSLMDVDDMPAAVLEVARILIRRGRFCICVPHPLADAGRFEEREGDAAFRITGSYLDRRKVHETFERDGLMMTFAGWAYPLEDYARALEEAGFLTELLREPPTPAESVERDPAEKRWARVPMFLFLRAIKSAY